jgi:hypothetical protein
MLAPDPAPDEVTSRYLRHSNQYAPSNGRVKPHALHPAPADHKTSVFRVQGFIESEIWSLGDEHILNPSGSELRARAELLVAQILGVDLQVEPQEPPQRHANIGGWPAEKDEWMLKAQELAAVATLRLRAAPTA